MSEETSPVLDLASALERVDGDKELLDELIEIFDEDREESLGRIAAAISSGESKELEESAHAFKGALGNLGATLGFDLAFKLESLGRGGSTEGAAEILEELKKAVQGFREAYDAS